MKQELINFLIQVDTLGLKSVKSEVQEEIQALADCIQKTESEAKAKMHMCVDENKIEPLYELSKLCTTSKLLSDSLKDLTKGDLKKLVEKPIEAPQPEEPEEPVEEVKSETTKEVKAASVKEAQPSEKEEPKETEISKGTLTVSMITRTPIALEINRTKHSLEEKNYRGLFETLLKVQAFRDSNLLRSWLKQREQNGDKYISVNTKAVRSTDLYISELKTYVNIQGNAEIMITETMDLLRFCNLQDLYCVYYAPSK